MLDLASGGAALAACGVGGAWHTAEALQWKFKGSSNELSYE